MWIIILITITTPQVTMKKLMLAMTPIILLSACGGSSDSNDGSQPTPVGQLETCGDDFSVVRDYTELDMHSSSWYSSEDKQADRESLPRVEIYTDPFKGLHETFVTSSSSQCLQSSKVFVGIGTDEWEGEAVTGIKAGDDFYYDPVFTFDYARPVLASYQSWVDDGKPNSIATVLQGVSLDIHYKKDDMQFIYTDVNTMNVSLQCDRPIVSTLSLYEDTAGTEVELIETLQMDINYCGEVFSGTNGSGQAQDYRKCLNVSPVISDKISIDDVVSDNVVMCDFTNTKVELPDNKRGYQSVTISGKLEREKEGDFKLTINNVGY